MCLWRGSVSVAFAHAREEIRHHYNYADPQSTKKRTDAEIELIIKTIDDPNPPNGQICMTFIARNYRAEVKRATKRTTQRIASSESTNGLIFFTKRGQYST